MNTSITRVILNFDFRMLWFSQISSQISLNILSFVMAIEVYRMTASNTAVSLMLLTFGIPAIVFGFIFGGIVDQFDKKAIIVFCNLSRAFVLIFYYFFSGNLYMLYGLSVILSIITQLFIPAEVPSIPRLVKKDDLLSANSLFTITFYLSTVMGSIFAGTLLKAAGIKNVFLIIGVLMFLASYFSFRLPGIKPGRKIKFKLNTGSLTAPIREGLAFIRAHSRIRQGLYLLTFSQSLIFALAVLGPGFADKILKIDVESVSLIIMGPTAFGLILGAYIAGPLSKFFLRGSIVLAGILLTGISLIFLSVLSNQMSHGMIYFIMMMLTLLGISNSLINVPVSTILQGETEEDLRGRVYGILTSLTGGFSIIPVLFSGIMADTIGVGRTMYVIGIVVTFIGIYYLIKRKGIVNYS